VARCADLAAQAEVHRLALGQGVAQAAVHSREELQAVAGLVAGAEGHRVAIGIDRDAARDDVDALGGADEAGARDRDAVAHLGGVAGGGDHGLATAKLVGQRGDLEAAAAVDGHAAATGPFVFEGGALEVERELHA
jgi:hypothetical protein